MVTELLERPRDRQREALLLRYVSQLTIPEIAKVMGCAEGTVKATLHAAISKASLPVKDTLNVTTDQVQELFDRAIASVSPRTPLPTHALHARLHQRRIRARVSTIGACLLAVAVSASVLVIGLASKHRLRRHALSLWFGVVEHDAAFGRSTSDDRAFARRGFHERLGCRVARQVGRYQRTQGTGKFDFVSHVVTRTARSIGGLLCPIAKRSRLTGPTSVRMLESAI